MSSRANYSSSKNFLHTFTILVGITIKIVTSKNWVATYINKITLTNKSL